MTLKDLATIRETYRERRSVRKIQGHEAVTFSVRKSISSDILKAREKVFEVVEMFRARNKEGPIKIKLMDDESYDVTNRLGLISSNGLLGFLFILLFLFLALDFKTGFWVACGIPFSLAVSITLAHIIGYTVNNVTLAAVIIIALQDVFSIPDCRLPPISSLGCMRNRDRRRLLRRDSRPPLGALIATHTLSRVPDPDLVSVGRVVALSAGAGPTVLN